MLYGLYLSAQGAEAQSTRIDVIANNLANAQTNAFKRDLAVFRARDPHDVRKQHSDEPPNNLNDSTGGTHLFDIVTDFSDGSQIATGGAYDLAVSGPGFLQVSDGNQNFLTRNGAMTVNADGELVTQDQGHQVLAAGGGPVLIPPEATQVVIAADGTINIFNQAGQGSVAGQIALVEPESHDALMKMGNSLYLAQGEVIEADESTQVRQGYLETSGTNSVMDMLQMVEASRAYETNINMIKFQDEALGQLLRAVPR